MDSFNTASMYLSWVRWSNVSIEGGWREVVIKFLLMSSCTILCCTAGFLAMQYRVNDREWAVVSRPPMRNVPISATNCSSGKGPPASAIKCVNHSKASQVFLSYVDRCAEPHRAEPMPISTRPRLWWYDQGNLFILKSQRLSNICSKDPTIRCHKEDTQQSLQPPPVGPAQSLMHCFAIWCVGHHACRSDPWITNLSIKYFLIPDELPMAYE